MEVPLSVGGRIGEATSVLFDPEEVPLELLTLWEAEGGVSRRSRLHLHQLGVGVALDMEETQTLVLIEIPDRIELIKDQRDLADERSRDGEFTVVFRLVPIDDLSGLSLQSGRESPS